MTRVRTKGFIYTFRNRNRDISNPSRKHFKTLNLDESRSPDFDLFSDQEEYSEDRGCENAEAIDNFMSIKTQADYGSGVSRHKIVDKDNFELKGQFLKELRTNTFSGSDHEDPNEHIEKFHEIVDLFHIPNITIDQVMLRSFPMSLIGAASHWLRNKPSSSITTWEYLKTKFLSKYSPPTRTAKKMEEINNFQQEPDESLYQAWERFRELLMKCVIPSKTVADAKVAIQEITKYSQKWHNGTSRTRSIETSDGLAAIQAQLNNLGREIKKVNEKVYAAQVGCEQCKGPHYTKDYPLKEEGKTLEEAYYTQFEIRASTDDAIRNQGASIKTLEIQIGQMSNRKEDLEVYRAQMKLTQEDMSSRSQLLLKLIHTRYAVWDPPNTSLDPFLEDYIELNDLNVPLELRRDQADDLMPIIEEGKVIEEFRARNDARIVSKVFGYPSDYDHDKKIHIDCAYNLKFSCMIDFAILEDMDSYRDEGMSDGYLLVENVFVRGS
ncbi:reverse transcriptase domain-containing protein [Tanacetum coccineum]